jgi:S-adenosyl-L-methionine hydrolase (adenosine-forming)
MRAGCQPLQALLAGSNANPIHPLLPISRTWLPITILLVLLAFNPQISQALNGPPTVVFLSDFGTIDDSVAICKGVMLSIEPNLRIIDLTHQVTPFSIEDGARFLAQTASYFPAGTVFVAVVDPGVGSTRKPIVVKSQRNQFFVLPDNGLVSLVQKQDGIEEAREITNTGWMIGQARSSTFHGRDIFSPVAAHLARQEDWTQVGPVISGLAELSIDVPKEQENGVSGKVIGLDGPYGNLITNISAEIFQRLNYRLGEKIQTVIANRKFLLPYVKTFSDVQLHQPLLYIDSRGRVSIALNQGSFAKAFHISPPTSISIARKKNSDSQ